MVYGYVRVSTSDQQCGHRCDRRASAGYAEKAACRTAKNLLHLRK